MNLDDDSFIYKLVGVTIHTGTAQHGHYYSLINKNRGEKECDQRLEKWSNVEKDDWLKFDDDEVSTYLFSGMAGEAFGGDGTSLSNDEVTKLLASDKGYGKSAYMLVYECKKKKDVRQMQEDGTETKIDYKSVTKNIPDWLEQEIARDNTEFVLDSSVYNEKFFTFIKKALNHTSN